MTHSFPSRLFAELLGTADLYLETVAVPWQDKALEHAQNALGQAVPPIANVTPLRPKAAKASRENPYLAELLASQPITAPGSGKDIRHLEISLERSEEHTSELQSLMSISYAV